MTNDPDRLLKETLFELLRIIRNDELNFVDRSYGGVLVSEPGEPKKYARLKLEFEEAPTEAQAQIKKHLDEIEEAERAFEDAIMPGGFN